VEAERNAEEFYFPPGSSMARRVQGERSVGLLYGQRALLIGALEPLTYTGTMLSTWSGNRPAGPFPAGTPYSAFDSELMLWTLAVIADSGRAMYEALVRPLDPDERELLWRDYVRFGELFGLPASEVPASHVEFKAWFDGKLAAPDLTVTAHGREMAPLVAFRQPVPAPARGNIALQNHLIKGTLPPRVRAIFGIRWSRAHESSFRAMAAASRRSRGLFPYRMRRGRNDVFFDVVTQSERKRGGTATPQLGAGATR
jgi:uncharacterized protein (DUF2236 family)